mgnify:CR=1 FL=1
MAFDPAAQGLDQDEVDALVDETIEENDLVLFMKGSPMMPQCGYSKKAIGLIQRYRDDVEAVDVLASLDEFRTALERHSGWETIPQTYVDGEFIGGSDVLEELEERGELAAELGVDDDEIEADGGATDHEDDADGPDAPF